MTNVAGFCILQFVFNTKLLLCNEISSMCMRFDASSTLLANACAQVVNHRDGIMRVHKYTRVLSNMMENMPKASFT